MVMLFLHTFSCPDTDECANGNHNCDANAVCANTDGSFVCTCKAGYSGDGVSCDGKYLFNPLTGLIFVTQLTKGGGGTSTSDFQNEITYDVYFGSNG